MKEHERIVVNSEKSVRNEAEENGNKRYVYVYSCSSLEELYFERYLSFEDALKDAVKLMDAYVLFRGECVPYDAVDDRTVYYLDLDTKKKVEVKLE